jgi:hypothetical protein
LRARLPATALLTLVLALSLGACGGGDGTASGPQAAQEESGGPRVRPLEVSGGGSAQFRVKDGDNSIQEYGSEAGREQLREAARTVHAYYAALATEAWRNACSHLGREELAHLTTLAAKLRRRGCAPVLAKLFGSVSPAEGREATAVDAVSLRRDGAQGFLIYRGAQGKAYFILLRHEGGGWTVAALGPSGLG